MIAPNTVEAALESLRPGLDADGFELRQGKPSSGTTVEVVLAAKPTACLDCLVPEHMLISIIEDAIRRQDPSLTRVELVKEGFEGLEEP